MTTKIIGAVKAFIKNTANEINAKSLKKAYPFAILFILAFCFNNLTRAARNENPKFRAAALTLEKDTLRNFYRNYVSAGNSRDFTAIEKMISDSVIINGVPMKRDAVLTSLKGFVDAVPNLTWYIEDLIIEGDHIAANFRVTGTPKATTFFGQNPKGNSVEFTEFAFYKVRNGRFVEMSFLIDMPTIIKQLNK